MWYYIISSYRNAVAVLTVVHNARFNAKVNIFIRYLNVAIDDLYHKFT
jgi:hypothetical protein